jgi:ribonuclease-3
MRLKVSDVEEILGYNFKNTKLLDEALTHPSISMQRSENEAIFNYERLEFLGDAVLALVVAELLVNKYPNEREGSLAKRHSGLVHGEALAVIAENLGISQYIKMTAGEASSGGRQNRSNMENTLEAIIGAIYMDGGIGAAKSFVMAHWKNAIEQMTHPPKDAKTSLQEWAQGRGLGIPVYEVARISGPAHEPHFVIRVIVDGYESAEASGPSKKKAEKAAAEMLLERLVKLA